MTIIDHHTKFENNAEVYFSLVHKHGSNNNQNITNYSENCHFWTGLKSRIKYDKKPLNSHLSVFISRIIKLLNKEIQIKTILYLSFFLFGFWDNNVFRMAMFTQLVCCSRKVSEVCEDGDLIFLTRRSMNVPEIKGIIDYWTYSIITK